MRAALSIGANLGDRRAALQHAVDVLRGAPGVVRLEVSPVYETEPIGGVAQPPFLNAVVVLDVTGTSAEEVAAQLLATARQAEADLARVRDVRWGPRTLDVDVLTVGSLVSDDPELTLPHSRLAERAFVLVPWADVDPDGDVPGLGTVRALLSRLPLGERSGVRPATGVVVS